MYNKHQAVIGIYRTRTDAERCVSSLKADGFSADDISILMPDRDGSQDFAFTKDSKVPEGAATGAGTGAVVGGALGLLVGLGIPEYEAKRYEGIVKNGGILLSVHADNSEEVAKAKRCLEMNGAEDISSTGESRDGWTSSVRPDKTSSQSSDHTNLR